MAKTIVQVQSPDRVINQLQQNIINTLQPILKNGFVSGTQLTEVELVSGQVNIVNHGLNRKLVGWVLTRVRAQSTVWDSQDSNPEQTKTLWLNCSANVVVDLYVY